MKKFLIIAILIPMLFSCRNGDKKPSDKEDIPMENRSPGDTTSETPDGEIMDEAATERDGVQTEVEDQDMNSEEKVTDGLMGAYKLFNSDGTSGTCPCNCIEVSYSAPTELCVTPDKIYISARYSKAGTNKANIFLVDMLRSEIPERDIPWDDFDRDTPIATVTRQPNGSLELDWLGFSIGGEVAVDYAIYGKKNLEGNYKRM